MKINNKGFTFGEILAVIIIIGLLTGISIAAFSRYKENAIKSDFEALAKSSYNAMEEYMMNHPYENTVTLETLEKENLISNRKDPGSKEDCTGTVEISKNTGTNGKIDDGIYTVNLCCISNQRTYTYPGGKSEELTDSSKCNYTPEEEPTPPSPNNTKIKCAAGKYLPKNKTACANCTSGNYCLGGEWYKNTTKDQGLTPCPNGYKNSSVGSKKQTDCYMKVAENKYVKNKKDKNATNCPAGYAKTAHNVNYNGTSTCSKKTIVVTFNCNGGTGGGTQTFTYGKTGQYFNKTCNRSGYTLNGWKKVKTANSRDYIPKNEVINSWINNNSPKITLYAHWVMNKPNTPTITNPSGGNWVRNDITLTLSTTSPAEILGNWYYSYNNKTYTQYSGQSGKKSFKNKITNEMNKIIYVKVCNRNAKNATDNTNCSSVATTYIRIDKTHPTCTMSYSCSEGGGVENWCRGTQTITGSCTGAGSGSPCNTTKATKAFSAENQNGNNILIGSVKDQAGNPVECRAQVKIDKTPPLYKDIYYLVNTPLNHHIRVIPSFHSGVTGYNWPGAMKVKLTKVTASDALSGVYSYHMFFEPTLLSNGDIYRPTNSTINEINYNNPPKSAADCVRKKRRIGDGNGWSTGYWCKTSDIMNKVQEYPISGSFTRWNIDWCESLRVYDKAGNSVTSVGSTQERKNIDGSLIPNRSGNNTNEECTKKKNKTDIDLFGFANM